MDGFDADRLDEREGLLSVGQLTARIKQTLEGAFPAVWVVGEVTDLARPRSGHIYLTLKDASAQIRAVLWRTVATRLPFDLEDGQEVICQGNVEVYAPRGSYQLVIRRIEPRGMGALQLALRRLQSRLAAEGLFDPARKRPLPRFPRRIAVVTSPTGAAVRDFLEVVRGRWQGADVLVVPTKVQGEGAAEEIAAAIALVNRLRPAPSVLVVTRGGGSMEDLWCFNEEAVVRAIHGSSVPVVSAIGHEIDVTLSDLVADVRALTPTEAAQRVVPSADEIAASLAHLATRLRTALRQRALRARARLEAIAERRVLQRPLERVRDAERRLDEWHARAARAIDTRLRAARQILDARASQLESLGPLSVLARGYSLTQRESDDALVTDATTLCEGERIRTRYAAGTTISRVEGVRSADDAERLRASAVREDLKDGKRIP
jgi:exodeoxyribonuclease VII large subunit